MSLPALIAPGEIIAINDAYIMLAATLILWVVAGWGKKRQINRLEGGILLSGFIAYQLYLFLA